MQYNQKSEYGLGLATVARQAGEFWKESCGLLLVVYQKPNSSNGGPTTYKSSRRIKPSKKKDLEQNEVRTKTPGTMIGSHNFKSWIL